MNLFIVYCYTYLLVLVVYCTIDYIKSDIILNTFYISNLNLSTYIRIIKIIQVVNKLFRIF